MSFAKGKYAIGLCDVCGFRYPLAELKPNIVMGHVTGILACDECNDPDHPQNFIGQVSLTDPQALRNPRPDTGLDASRELITTQLIQEMYVERGYVEDGYVE